METDCSECKEHNKDARDKMSPIQMAADDLVSAIATFAIGTYTSDLIYQVLSAVIQGRKALRLTVDGGYFNIKVTDATTEV